MRLINSAVLVAVLALAAPQPSTAQENAAGEASEYLLVLNAKSVVTQDGALTVIGSPAVTYFSDRPVRTAGHMTLQSFVDQWDSFGFDADPPNAALATLGDRQGVTVVELHHVELDGDKLRFGYRVIEGDEPSGDLGPASLFVDVADIHPMEQSSLGPIKK